MTQVVEQQDTAAPSEPVQPSEPVEELTTDQQVIEEPTDSEAEPTEEAPKPRSLTDMSDEELEADERVTALRKAWEAKASESARLSAESSEKKKAKKAAQDFRQTGQARNLLNGQVQTILNRIRPKLENGDQVDSSEMVPDQGIINWIGQQMYAGAYGDVADHWIEAAETFWPKDTPMPRELVEMGTRVKDGNHDVLGAHIQKFLEAYGQSAVEAELPKLKKQWEKERKDSDRAAAENRKSEEADAGREGQLSPTGSGGGSAAGNRTAREIFDDPKSTQEQRAAAYEKLYGRKFEVIQ